MKSNNNKTVDNWKAINKSLFLYKVIGIGAILVGLFSSMTSLYLVNADPIIAMVKNDRKTYIQGSKNTFTVTSEDVEDFVIRYTHTRYDWKEFDPMRILKDLECITTKTYRKKLLKLLGEEKHNNKDEKIEQYISYVRPVLGKNEAHASFDRVIRINNIPIIVPTELDLTIIQDVKTRCNPTGLYVNGATEYAAK